MTVTNPSAFPTRRSQHQAQKPPKKKAGFGFVLTGVVGELLITVAIILGLYVAWQVWWTSLEVTPGIQASVSTFQSHHAPTITAGDTAPTERTDDPPAVAGPAAGEVFGVLHMPQWDWAQLPIAEGTGLDVINLGYAGHYIGTQLPGEVGNFALAGHRRTYGDIFLDVDKLVPGDQFVVETADAYLVYEMTSYEIIEPHQAEVLLPVPNEPGVMPTKRIMTLTTCHPDWSIRERYIVYSEFKYWTDKAEGKPTILRNEPTR